MEEIKLFDAETVKTRMLQMYPLGYVPRNKIGEATGGILGYQNMANRDSDKRKKSIQGTIKIGGKICYPVERVIEFIESEIRPVR